MGVSALFSVGEWTPHRAKYRKGQPLPKGSRGDAGFGPKVFTEENLEAVERLTKFAESRGHAILELAFSWLAAQPAVASVIAGATSPEQVKANAVAPRWKLSTADLQEINGLLAQPSTAAARS